MISKHKMRLRYHDVCAQALEDCTKSMTTANCGWNATQKELNVLREYLFSKALEHRDKRLALIEAENARKAKHAADKVPA